MTDWTYADSGRADEQTRAADIISLRVCGKWLLLDCFAHDALDISAARLHDRCGYSLV
jgi:hypothetical protein